MYSSVELYAEDIQDENPQVTGCTCKEKITGAIQGYCYQAEIESTRPSTDFIPRIIPHHAEAKIPAEASLIVWQR